MTIREWWYETGEPVDMLSNPQATFRADEDAVVEWCRRGGIPHRPPGEDYPIAFPAWLLAVFYKNP
jgi:hypothetical protein